MNIKLLTQTYICSDFNAFLIWYHWWAIWCQSISHPTVGNLSLTFRASSLSLTCKIFLWFSYTVTLKEYQWTLSISGLISFWSPKKLSTNFIKTLLFFILHSLFLGFLSNGYQSIWIECLYPSTLLLHILSFHLRYVLGGVFFHASSSQIQSFSVSSLLRIHLLGIFAQLLSITFFNLSSLIGSSKLPIFTALVCFAPLTQMVLT